MQIVGKIRLAHAPMENHLWQVALYVSPRGLTTSAILYRGALFEIEFDFIDHQLRLRTCRGTRRTVALEPKSVSAFYAETMRELGLDASIHPVPVEVVRAVPFAEDTEYHSYNPDHAHRYWLQFVTADRVMKIFRSPFAGKMSPVQFFWGSMDLAYTRFSGAPAPPHPGGVPNTPDWVMVEAYNRALSSCGFWAGGSSEGSFYAYAYPAPTGYAEHEVIPDAAFFNSELGEFLLPYEAVRTAPNPDEFLLDFLETTYEAAVDTGKWNRHALEEDPNRLGVHR